MEASEKVKENRIRRMAERQGMTLSKSRRRDPRAIDYGGYMLVDTIHNTVVYGATPIAFSASLDEIERFLMEDRRPT